MTKYREILRLINNQLKTDEIVAACGVSKKLSSRSKSVLLNWESAGHSAPT